MDSIVWGVGILTIAIVASKSEGLLYLGLKAQSWTGGTLLALFLTKVVFKKYFRYQLTPWSVIGAYIFGMSGVYLNTQVLNWNWNLNVYWGCGLSIIFLKIFSSLKSVKQGPL
jgi:hypothetical protein